jgi:thiopeptide-type bacteriocin biosynthesis protein
LRTPPHLQNDLLQELAPTLASMRGLGLIDGFFFVRYRDERGAHLRLRLFDPRGRAMEQALSSLRPVLELATQRRILHTASAEPYVREINRYGGEARTSICERIFFVDSALMLDALRELDVSGIQVWRDAASAIDSMLLALGVGGLRSRLAFARRASADFDREQRFSSEERKRIGQIYATSRGLPVAEDHIPERTGIPSAGVFAAGTEQLRSLWDAFLAVPEPVGHEQIYSVQWSLIHMRMNRLFDRDARLQEAIVWELLKRSYAEATSRAERLGDP